MWKSSIIGCGAIAQVHAAAIDELENVTLLSAADIRPERAEALTKQYGAAPYSCIDELLKAEKPDVVHICTPHYTHVPLAETALATGCDVVLEKPCCMTLDELPRLKTAVAKSGRHLGVCFQNRYRETSLRAKELITSGAAGKILGARGVVTWKRDEKYYVESGWRGKRATEGGGVMINQAIHTLDLMLWLCGDPVTVEGSTANHHLKGVIDVEDTAEACFTFGDGTRGLFYASTSNCFDSPVYLEVCCENFNLVLEGDDLTVRAPGGKVLEYRSCPLPVRRGKACWGAYHETLFRDYYDCLGSGRAFPIDVDEAGRAVTALLRLYESAENGGPVAFQAQTVR